MVMLDPVLLQHFLVARDECFDMQIVLPPWIKKGVSGGEEGKLL